MQSYLNIHLINLTAGARLPQQLLHSKQTAKKKKSSPPLHASWRRVTRASWSLCSSPPWPSPCTCSHQRRSGSQHWSLASQAFQKSRLSPVTTSNHRRYRRRWKLHRSAELRWWSWCRAQATSPTPVCRSLPAPAAKASIPSLTAETERASAFATLGTAILASFCRRPWTSRASSGSRQIVITIYDWKNLLSVTVSPILLYLLNCMQLQSMIILICAVDIVIDCIEQWMTCRRWLHRHRERWRHHQHLN